MGILNRLEQKDVAEWANKEKPNHFSSEDPNVELIFEMYKKLENLL